MRTLRIALAQVNTAVGDIDGNARLIIDSMAKAREHGAALVAFPELAMVQHTTEMKYLGSAISLSYCNP